jgi:2',3'-cyclic-nucleotide 2'-phosphodiesterase (5'-nucleotidase family)
MVVSKSDECMVNKPSLISNKKLFKIGIIGLETTTPSIKER